MILCYFSSLEGATLEQKLEFMFLLYDKDSNGILDKQERPKVPRSGNDLKPEESCVERSIELFQINSLSNTDPLLVFINPKADSKQGEQ
ncbi:unnamed protein product [Rotaria sp. Silwood2]|nr:unnamed protein product [Rotaria sp. Silwood2]